MKNFWGAALLAASCLARADDYSSCLIGNLSGVQSQPAHLAAVRVCMEKFPGGFYQATKGHGRGLPILTPTPDECTVKNAKSTLFSASAALISSACKCLYEPARYKGEMCAYPPLDLTHQFTLEADRVPDSPGKPGGVPSVKETPQEVLQRYADGVIKQYPFLDRPEYTKVVSLIVAERDRLMAQGVAAPQALQRAADAIAPQFDPGRKN